MKFLCILLDGAAARRPIDPQGRCRIFRVCRRRHFLTGNSNKNIAEFMGHCEYLRSKELKKLGYLVHFHRRGFFSVAFGVFSFFERLSLRVVGVLDVRSPPPGGPGVKKCESNLKLHCFKKSQNAL